MILQSDDGKSVLFVTYVDCTKSCTLFKGNINIFVLQNMLINSNFAKITVRFLFFIISDDIIYMLN